MSSNVPEVTDATFEADVLQSTSRSSSTSGRSGAGRAAWSRPRSRSSRRSTPAVVEVRKLDVDANPQTAMHYGIMSIPTVAMFAPGEPPRAAVGFRPAEALEEAFGLAAYRWRRASTARGRNAHRELTADRSSRRTRPARAYCGPHETTLGNAGRAMSALP